MAPSTTPKSWGCCPHWDEGRIPSVRAVEVPEQTGGSSFGLQAAEPPMGQQHQGRNVPTATASLCSKVASLCFIGDPLIQAGAPSAPLHGQSPWSVSKAADFPQEALSTLARTQPPFSWASPGRISSRTRPAQIGGSSQVWLCRGVAQEGERGGTAAAALRSYAVISKSAYCLPL